MGDNNATIVLILLVVVGLFFIFATYMNTKTWRALHVTFLFLAFIAANVFLVLAAANMKARAAWLKVEEELVKQQAKLKDEVELKKSGDRKIPKDVLGWRDYREMVHRAVLDRGRVWRKLTAAEAPQIATPGASDSEVKVTLNVGAGVLEGQAPKPHNMTERTVVYAFKDLSTPEASKYIYLGEFFAAAVTETSISLTSTMPLTSGEQGLIAGAQPWILYETMPRDSQQAYNVDPQVTLANLFTDAQLQSVLADYQRDGKPAEANDPPENVYAKVKFLKDYKYTVDAPEGRSPVGQDSRSDIFDTQGQALIPSLQRGKEVEFKTGATAELLYSGKDSKGDVQIPGAEQLAEQGIVEVVEKVYRRKLNDYSYEFRHIWARKRQIVASLHTLEYELNRVTKEIATTEANIKLQKDRITKLESDKTRVVDEKQKITTYANQLEKVFQNAKQQFNSLIVRNNALHEEILSTTKRLLTDVNRRTATPASVNR